MVAVGKTSGERAGWLVRVGSEKGHVVRRIQPVRREGVVHRASEVHLHKRAARFPERLYPTASMQGGSGLADQRFRPERQCWSGAYSNHRTAVLRGWQDWNRRTRTETGWPTSRVWNGGSTR